MRHSLPFVPKECKKCKIFPIIIETTDTFDEKENTLTSYSYTFDLDRGNGGKDESLYADKKKKTARDSFLSLACYPQVLLGDKDQLLG